MDEETARELKRMTQEIDAVRLPDGTSTDLKRYLDEHFEQMHRHAAETNAFHAARERRGTYGLWRMVKARVGDLLGLKLRGVFAR